MANDGLQALAVALQSLGAGGLKFIDAREQEEEDEFQRRMREKLLQLRQEANRRAEEAHALNLEQHELQQRGKAQSTLRSSLKNLNIGDQGTQSRRIAAPDTPQGVAAETIPSALVNEDVDAAIDAASAKSGLTRDQVIEQLAAAGVEAQGDIEAEERERQQAIVDRAKGAFAAARGRIAADHGVFDLDNEEAVNAALEANAEHNATLRNLEITALRTQIQKGRAAIAKMSEDDKEDNLRKAWQALEGVYLKHRTLNPEMEKQVALQRAYRETLSKYTNPREQGILSGVYLDFSNLLEAEIRPTEEEDEPSPFAPGPVDRAIGRGIGKAADVIADPLRTAASFIRDPTQ